MYVKQYSQQYNVPERFAFNILRIETCYKGLKDSNYSYARNINKSCVGVMQILLSTANMVLVSDDSAKTTKKALMNNVELNIMVGMHFLRILYDKYHNWQKVAGAYNTGRPVKNKYSIFAIKGL